MKPRQRCGRLGSLWVWTRRNTAFGRFFGAFWWEGGVFFEIELFCTLSSGISMVLSDVLFDLKPTGVRPPQSKCQMWQCIAKDHKDSCLEVKNLRFFCKTF